jgi:hypothetical protein
MPDRKEAVERFGARLEWERGPGGFEQRAVVAPEEDGQFIHIDDFLDERERRERAEAERNKAWEALRRVRRSLFPLSQPATALEIIDAALPQPEGEER